VTTVPESAKPRKGSKRKAAAAPSEVTMASASAPMCRMRVLPAPRASGHAAQSITCSSLSRSFPQLQTAGTIAACATMRSSRVRT